MDEKIWKIRERLLSPGSPFEVIEEEVLGEKLPVFKQRKRSLRELVTDSEGLGDQEYLVNDRPRITFRDHGKLVASVAAALRAPGGP